MKHFSIKVSGNVQGVFFRASTRDVGEKLGVKGFVRNERDGTVYIEAEGEDEEMKQFIAWCHHGPSHANVENITITEGSAQGYTKFEVRR